MITFDNGINRVTGMQKMHVRKIWRGLAALISITSLLVLFAGAANAGIQEKIAQCHNSYVKPNARISACTWLLRSGNLLDEDIPIVYGFRGVGYTEKGQQNNALRDFSRAINLNPTYFYAYLYRGIVYGEKGQYLLAIKDFDKAIEIKTDSAVAYYNRGVANTEMQQNDLAIRDFSQAIRLAPDDAGNFYNRGLVFATGDQYELAILDFNRAIELNPDMAKAFRNRGLAYSKQRQFDLALLDYDKAIGLDPRFVRALNDRGLAYFKKGQYDLAIIDLTKAIGLVPGLGYAYDNRGMAYVKKGNYQYAIQDFEKSIELDSSDDSVYFNMAEVLAAAPDDLVRNGKKAIRMAMKALKLSNIPKNQFVLAAAYAEVGMFGEAVKQQQDALNRLISEEGDGNVAEYRKMLNLFKKKQPYRLKLESFPNKNSNGGN